MYNWLCVQFTFEMAVISYACGIWQCQACERTNCRRTDKEAQTNNSNNGNAIRRKLLSKKIKWGGAVGCPNLGLSLILFHFHFNRWPVSCRRADRKILQFVLQEGSYTKIDTKNNVHLQKNIVFTNVSSGWPTCCWRDTAKNKVLGVARTEINFCEFFRGKWLRISIEK